MVYNRNCMDCNSNVLDKVLYNARKQNRYDIDIDSLSLKLCEHRGKHMFIYFSCFMCVLYEREKESL